MFKYCDSQDDNNIKIQMRDRLPRKIFLSENSSSTHYLHFQCTARCYSCILIRKSRTFEEGGRRRITCDKNATGQGAIIHFM